MRGCLQKLGILIGVLIVIAVVVAVAFWLNWKQEKELFEQARDAYYDGNPADALGSYQVLLDRFSLTDAQQREANDSVEELEDFLQAVNLQENGMVSEAINAYESFLDEHFRWGMNDQFYCSHARKALATLKPGQAQDLHESGIYPVAIEVYLSLLGMDLLGESECGPVGSTYERHIACQEADTAVGESHIKAQAAIPMILNEWAEIMRVQGKYQEFIEWCDDTLKNHPNVLNDAQVRAMLAQHYSDWASSLREVESYPEAIEKYKIIIDRYSDTTTGALARASLDETRTEFTLWLEQNPAVPVIEFPVEVRRDADGRWSWTTVFKEIDGRVGYTLAGEGWIEDVNGRQYGPWGSEVSRGTVNVLAGGMTEDSYWVRGDTFEDGYAVITWTGEDEGGHPITLEEKVHLLP